MSRNVKLIPFPKAVASQLQRKSIPGWICLHRATNWSFTNRGAILRIQSVGLLCTVTDNSIGFHD
jgi:hypothetical protein